MIVDIRTVLIILLMNLSLIGVMFIAGWLRNRSIAVYRRGGIAVLMLASGLGLLLLRGRIPDRESIDIANALILIGLGLGWSAVRRFDRRRASPWIVFAGGAVWLVACTIPALYDSLAYRIVLSSAISAGYVFAVAWEFGRVSLEASAARRPLAIICAIHGVFVICRGIAVLLDPPVSLFKGNWIQGLLLAEPALMVIALSILGVVLVRERGESELRRHAETDALTGVLNRRAIFAGAAEAIAEARRRGWQVALLLFDLDHFKTINDRFGHSFGDETLCAFSRVASAAIRQTDLFGRIGGEEFAAVLTGADERTAHAIANRIRLDFSRQCLSPDGNPATVSIGVAAAGAADADFEALLLRADKALYEAKRSGRDRVIGQLALAS